MVQKIFWVGNKNMHVKYYCGNTRTQEQNYCCEDEWRKNWFYYLNTIISLLFVGFLLLLDWISGFSPDGDDDPVPREELTIHENLPSSLQREHCGGNKSDETTDGTDRWPRWFSLASFEPNDTVINTSCTEETWTSSWNRHDQPVRAVTHPIMSPTGNPLNSTGKPVCCSSAGGEGKHLDPKHQQEVWGKISTTASQSHLETKIHAILIIVGGFNHHFSSAKRTKVLCFLNDTMTDLTEKMLPIINNHPNIQNLNIHIGGKDLAKQNQKWLPASSKHNRQSENKDVYQWTKTKSWTWRWELQQTAHSQEMYHYSLLCQLSDPHWQPQHLWELYPFRRDGVALHQDGNYISLLISSMFLTPGLKLM